MWITVFHRLDQIWSRLHLVCLTLCHKMYIVDVNYFNCFKATICFISWLFQSNISHYHSKPLYSYWLDFRQSWCKRPIVGWLEFTFVWMSKPLLTYLCNVYVLVIINRRPIHMWLLALFSCTYLRDFRDLAFDFSKDLPLSIKICYNLWM